MNDSLICPLAIISAVGIERPNVVGVLTDYMTNFKMKFYYLTTNRIGMSKNILFITGSLVLAMASAKAQFVVDYLKAADGYYKQADYYSATQYYTKYLALNTSSRRQGYNPYAIAIKEGKKKKATADSLQAVLYHLAES